MDMDEPGGHHAKGSKPVTKKPKYSMIPLRMRSLEESKSETEVERWSPGAGERGAVSAVYGHSFSFAR